MQSFISSSDVGNLKRKVENFLDASESTPDSIEQRKRRLTVENEVRRAREEERKKVVAMCSCVLEQIFSGKSDRLPSDPSKITLFHSEKTPSMPVSKYFQRIATYSECSTECLVMGLLHINCLLTNKSNFEVNTLNIHRLVLTSIMCSAKFFDDQYYNNAYYARIGGVTLRELNCLEVAFLALIGFDLFIPVESYKMFYDHLGGSLLHSDCNCELSQLQRVPAQPVHQGPPRPPMVIIPEPSVVTHPAGSNFPPISPIEPMPSQQYWQDDGQPCAVEIPTFRGANGRRHSVELASVLPSQTACAAPVIARRHSFSSMPNCVPQCPHAAIQTFPPKTHYHPDSHSFADSHMGVGMHSMPIEAAM